MRSEVTPRRGCPAAALADLGALAILVVAVILAAQMAAASLVWN
jgi:hypothetical protein